MKEYFKDVALLMMTAFTTGGGILCTAIGIKSIKQIVKQM